MLASEMTIDEKGSEDTFRMISSKFLICFLMFEIKRKMIWKDINNMISRFEFIIEKRKRREKLVIFIIHIDDRQF